MYPVNIQIKIKSINVKYGITKIPVNSDYKYINGLYFHNHNKSFTSLLQFFDTNYLELSCCDSKEIKLRYSNNNNHIITVPLSYLEKIEKKGLMAFEKELKKGEDNFILEENNTNVRVTLRKGFVSFENEESEIIFSVIDSIADYK